MTKPRYTLRYETDKGGWAEDSELGVRKSVALDELRNLVDCLERKFEDDDREWAYITLIMEQS